MRLTIRAKLLGGFTLLLLLMIVMAVVSHITSNQIEETNQEAVEWSEQMQFIEEAKGDQLQWVNELSNLFTLEDEFTGELDYNKCEFGLWYYSYEETEQYEQLPFSFQETFASIREPHRLLHESGANIVNILEREGFEDGYDKALQVYEQETQQHVQELDLLMDNIINDFENQVDAALTRAEEQGNRANFLVTATTALTIVIGLILAFVISQNIRKSIDKILYQVNRIRENDLTAQVVDVANDECGEIAGSLNKALYSLNGVLNQVKLSAENVENASKEIESGNQDLSQRTEEQSSSLEEISSTIEEIDSSLEETTSNAKEANNLAYVTLQSVEKGSIMIKDMQTAIDNLTQGSQEIAEIITKVNDIAFQTNLLALNAAVEAARAGEQGRGFAVVASEVRNLASRSAESAGEIERLIQNSVNQVEHTNELMNNTEGVLQEIVNNSQKTSDIVGEITASIGDQSMAMGDIRTAIEELNQVTQQNASMVEEIASSSTSMREEAEELEAQINVFKLNKDSAKSIKTAPESISNYSSVKGQFTSFRK